MEKVKPKYSVIMPVYNGESYIKEAIESVLNQTVKDFEFIIINDGSTDKTLEIIKAYANKDSRIRIINQSHSGIVKALNKGLREARGEWIFRMDADDISLPCRFETQIKVTQREHNIVLAGGWCEMIDQKGNYIKTCKYPTKHAVLMEALEKNKPFFPHPTAFFMRKVVLELGGYRERFRHAEDIDLWLRIGEKGRLTCCEKVILKLRKHQTNVSTSAFRSQLILSIAAKICHYYRKNGLLDPSEMEEEEWNKFLNWLKKYLEKSRYILKRESLMRLRNSWYEYLSQSGLNKFKSFLNLFEKVDKYTIKALIEKFLKEDKNFLIELMQESLKNVEIM